MTKHDKHLIDIYKAVYLLDGIEEPFQNFGPDHPKIGDKVRPSNYFSDDFVYKLDSVPFESKLTKKDVLSTYWKCTAISHRNWHVSVTFKSLDKINGRRRSLTYKDRYKLECEIVDIPEKSRLIIDYKNGKYTLVELLKIFQEKKYNSRIYFKSSLLDMSGDEYLQVIEELTNEGNKI